MLEDEIESWEVENENFTDQLAQLIDKKAEVVKEIEKRESDISATFVSSATLFSDGDGDNSHEMKDIRDSIASREASMAIVSKSATVLSAELSKMKGAVQPLAKLNRKLSGLVRERDHLAESSASVSNKCINFVVEKDEKERDRLVPCLCILEELRVRHRQLSFLRESWRRSKGSTRYDLATQNSRAVQDIGNRVDSIVKHRKRMIDLRCEMASIKRTEVTDPVDLANDRTRLQSEKERLEGEIGGMRSGLISEHGSCEVPVVVRHGYECMDKAYGFLEDQRIALLKDRLDDAGTQLQICSLKAIGTKAKNSMSMRRFQVLSGRLSEVKWKLQIATEAVERENERLAKEIELRRANKTVSSLIDCLTKVNSDLCVEVSQAQEFVDANTTDVGRICKTLKILPPSKKETMSDSLIRIVERMGELRQPRKVGYTEIPELGEELQRVKTEVEFLRRKHKMLLKKAALIR